MQTSMTVKANSVLHHPLLSGSLAGWVDKLIWEEESNPPFSQFPEEKYWDEK